jgi:CRISPR-associated protein Csm1
MQERKIYNTVILAGLLGNLQRLLPLLTEAELLNNFSDKLSENIDKKMFQELVAEGGNNYDNDVIFLRNLLECAAEYSSLDNIHSAEHINRDTQIPLASTFSYLQLNKPTSKRKFYRFQPLSPINGFPVDEENIDYKDRDKVVQSFKADFKTLVDKLITDNFDNFYTHIALLIQKYLWCIPVNPDGDGSDICWFDYLKNTVAITSCLYKFHKDTQDFDISSIKEGSRQKFILLVGDFSGIQRYIFDISTTGAGGIAKRLRARSFYLTALSEAASHKILHEFDLPLLNIVMASGGKFYIILPNMKQAKEHIEKLQQSFDEWFLEQYGGELSINLAHVSFCGNDFKHFGKVLSRLSRQLGEKKSRPLFDCLVDTDGYWREEKFVRFFKDERDLGLCQGCNKNFAEKIVDNAALCGQCNKDLHMGGLLPKTRYITFSRAVASGKDIFPLLDGYSLRLWPEVPKKDDGIYLAIRLNDVNCQELVDYPAGFRFIANYVPIAREGHRAENGEHKIAKGTVQDFDYISAKSKGREMLGYLKADVDNLGSLFIFGLSGDKKDLNTISRISALSRMLDTFFSGWIHEVVQTEFPNCYIVFSGGDDLFIIGPWNETIDLSLRINDEFRRFTANNPNITLSAGIAFSKPKIPVSTVVKQAEENLERSKEEAAFLSKEGSRNQLTVFEETVKWSGMENLMQDAKLLSDWLRLGDISAGFVHNLTIYNFMFKQYQKYGENDGLKYLPLLCYDIVRNLPTDDRNPQRREVRLWAEELKDIHSDRMNYLGFITGYALNSNRR